jgi:hypothetical protein
MDEIGREKEYQRTLEQTLRAYAVFDQETSYVQGMNFLTNILLTYLSPMVRIGSFPLLNEDSAAD